MLLLCTQSKWFRTIQRLDPPPSPLTILVCFCVGWRSEPVSALAKNSRSRFENPNYAGPNLMAMSPHPTMPQPPPFRSPATLLHAPQGLHWLGSTYLIGLVQGLDLALLSRSGTPWQPSLVACLQHSHICPSSHGHSDCTLRLHFHAHVQVSSHEPCARKQAPPPCDAAGLPCPCSICSCKASLYTQNQVKTRVKIESYYRAGRCQRLSASPPKASKDCLFVRFVNKKPAVTK